MTNERILPISTDTIIACALTDLYASHARNDLRESINACDDLAHFCDINLDELADADDLFTILISPFSNPDDDTDANLILDILRDDANRIHAAMMTFLKNLDY